MSLETPNNDLDFTKKEDFGTPEGKINALKKQIEAADNALQFAVKLNDSGRIEEVTRTREGLLTTLKELESGKDVQVPQTSETYDWGGDERASMTL